MRIYIVAVDSSTAEVEVLQHVKPPYLLLSYFYFRNKPLKDYLKKLGYQPKEILMDSGAFSALNKGRGIALTDYMTFIDQNPEITNYISLDVIGDEMMSYEYFRLMKLKGYNPIAVVHYGENYRYWLEKYFMEGERHIALGGTVPIKDKRKVAAWVNEIQKAFPAIQFHLLGSSSGKIVDHCDIFSCDSSTWFMEAINGKPKEIKGTTREAKIRRAIYNLKREVERCLK